jgi:hypothetical protein
MASSSGFESPCPKTKEPITTAESTARSVDCVSVSSALRSGLAPSCNYGSSTSGWRGGARLTPRSPVHRFGSGSLSHASLPAVNLNFDAICNSSAASTSGYCACEHYLVLKCSPIRAPYFGASSFG